ncbi:phosphonatase-like hydrolase [soil metagenome]
MKNKPELVIFDLAGTTVEDNHDVGRVLKMAMENFHMPVTIQQADAVMGIPKPLAIERLLKQHFHPDITPDLISEIHEIFIRCMIDFYRYDNSVREKEGVWETFTKLREENIKIAVDTGFDRTITNALLERLGWLDAPLIDSSVTSDEVEQGRPYPDLVFEAMKRTGISDASRVAKVGDTSFDIQEGKSAGCGWVIGITTGAFSEVDLAKENPTHLIRSISELQQIFL